MLKIELNYLIQMNNKIHSKMIIKITINKIKAKTINLVKTRKYNKKTKRKNLQTKIRFLLMTNKINRVRL